MAPTSESEQGPNLAEQVDAALSALWHGDGSELDRLVGAEAAAGTDLGELLGAAASQEASRTTAMPPPDAIPGYKLIREIGRGGMGVIYQALQEGTKRIVAVKVMLAGCFASDVAQRRFGREVELAARLQHPGIVRVLESSQLPGGQRYYAMDYVEGLLLDRYLKASAPDTLRVVQLFTELCEAVQHAHEHGVIHRDLKPGNVVIDSQGRPHVLDFGLAKSTDQSSPAEALTESVTSPGQVLGTLRYLSPEQAAGRAEEIDARTDVYSLGVMLFEALTGFLPYETSGHPSEILRRIVEESPRFTGSIASRLDRELETILFKALAKEKAERYASARDLGEDLRRYLNGEMILARQPSVWYVLRKKIHRHRWRISAAVVIVVLAAIAIGGGAWWRDRLQARRLALAEARDRQDWRRVALGIQRELEAGRGSRTIDQAKAPFEHHPELPETFLVWCQALYRTGRRTGDQILCNDAKLSLHRPPVAESEWATLLLRAEILRTEGDPQSDALREEGERKAPDDAEAWYVRSFANLDTREAQRCLEAALQRNPRHDLAWLRLTYVCLLNGQPQHSLEAAEKLIDLGGSRYDLELLKAHILIFAGGYAEAVSLYTQLMSSGPAPVQDHYELYLRRAIARLCLGDYEGAVEDYSRASDEAGSPGAWLYYKRATPLWILGRRDEAAADYRKTLELQGSSASYAAVRLFILLREQARILAGEDRTAEAEAALAEANEVLARGRRSVAPASWLARILACLDDKLSADELAAGANADDIEEVCEALYYAGEACLLRGRVDEARVFFRRCVDTDLKLDHDQFPPDPMNEYHLASWRLELLPPDGDG